MKQKYIKTIGKIFLILVAIILVFALIFPLVNTKISSVSEVSAASAVSGDGVFVYGESGNTTPRTRDYVLSTNTFSGETGTLAGNTGFSFVVKTSPIILEAVAGYVDNGGTLQIMCYDGLTWSNEWSVSVGGAGTTRRFDIAYETSSGDVMVLYSTNAAGTNEMAYNTKPGTAACGSGNWTGATNLNPVRTSGSVQWVKMSSDVRSGQDLIAAIWADGSSDLSAMIWSGSAWGNEPSAVLDASLEVASAAQDVQSFDVTHESTSGNVMVVWSTSGSGATNLIKYNRCTGGTSACSWVGTANVPTVADAGTNLDIASNPNTNEISMAALDNGSSDLSLGYWSGSAWTGTANVDVSATPPTAGRQLVATGWLVSGATNRSVVVYSDTTAGTTGINWFVGNAGTFASQSDFGPSPVFGSSQNWYDIQTDPINKDKLLLTVGDVNADLFGKRLIMTATPAFTWSNSDGAVLEASLSQATWQPFSFAYWRSIRARLYVGKTAGLTATNLNSGDTAQYMNTTTCNSSSLCSAFTMDLTNGSETLNSLKVTETGTVNANTDLSNLAIFYDTDGNFSNGTTGQFGSTVSSFSSEAGTVSGSLLMTSGTTYYFYIRLDVKSGTPTYPKGGQTIGFQIAAIGDIGTVGTPVVTNVPVAMDGTTTVRPNATGTTFGTGLADGGRSGESIVISGFGFGVATAGANRSNCAGGVDVGCVRFVVGGNATVGNADVTAWSNTSITFSINASLASDGGTSGLEVVSGSQGDATPQTFFIYPNITGMTTCTSGSGRDNVCGTNAAMEYSGSDTFGLIQLNGDHFKASAGTVAFTGAFGSVAGTVHATSEGACAVGGWTSTSVCVEVSSGISDTINSGTVTLTRSGDSKTDVTNLQVLPRITSNTPTSGAVGGVVVIDGNHFCQTGTCPASPPSADYIVYFGSTQAATSDFVATGSCTGQGASWSNTKICVKVPAGTPAGSQNTKVVGTASPLYESQRVSFTVVGTTPNVPDVGPGTNKGQYRTDGTTVISIGAYTNQSTVVFKADISSSVSINMALQIEQQPVGTAFTCGAGACGAAVEGTVGGGGACNSCTSLAGARVDITGITDGSKHWQARVKNTTTNEYSAWVSFGGNAESAADFIVDTAAPTITFSGSDTCNDAVSGLSANGVTLSWTLNENATGQVEYSTDSGLSGSTSYPIPVNPSASSHAISLSNLNSNTTYYFKVKSQDAATNLAQRPSIAPFCSFTTTAVTQPGKTVSFHVAGETGVIANNSGNGSSYYFSVFIPETAYSFKSSYLEVTGYSLGGGTNSVQLQVNGQAVKTFAIDASSATHFRVLYPIDSGTLNVNDDLPCTDGNPSGTPPCNRFKIVPSVGQDINIGSAQVITTYGYTP
jgi:hypothetical protein